GGQTALNGAMALVQDGTLERFGVELIGANARAIQMAEDRAEFGAAMRRIGLATPVGRTVASVADGLAAVGETGFPAIIRPSYTFFFFRAEDGIRGRNVTGVQTCALPI